MRYLIYAAAVPFALLAASPASALCMVRQTPQGEVGALVPESEKAELQQLGYSETACTGTPASQQDAVEKVCALSTSAPQAVLDMLTAQFGLTPARLCSLGRSAVSSHNYP